MFHLTGDGEPMNPSNKELLQKNRSTLVENIDLKGVLLDILQSNGAITNKQSEKIQNANISHRNGMLLDYISAGADSVFYKLTDALNESNQNHLAKLLQPGYGKISIRIYSVLLHHIDVYLILH